MDDNIHIDDLVEGLLSQVETREKNIEVAIDEIVEINQDRWVKKTNPQYSWRVSKFVGYCKDEVRIVSLDEIETHNLASFGEYLKYSTELSPKSRQDILKSVRQFLEFGENRLYVPPYFSSYIEIPDLDAEDETRDESIDYEMAERALEILVEFAYASTEHAVMVLLANVGLRLGTVRALDVEDVSEQSKEIQIRNRPETGTRLKNGTESERNVRITEDTATVLRDYIDRNRPAVEDDHNRQPLIASENGRLSGSIYRKYVYKWTQPCRLGLDCPVDRDPEDCEARERLDKASKCPDSKSPHAGRSGYITYLDESGVELGDIAERCDLSPRMIKKHYSQADKGRRAENRFDRIQEQLDD